MFKKRLRATRSSKIEKCEMRKETTSLGVDFVAEEMFLVVNDGTLGCKKKPHNGVVILIKAPYL